MAIAGPLLQSDAYVLTCSAIPAAELNPQGRGREALERKRRSPKLGQYITRKPGLGQPCRYSKLRLSVDVAIRVTTGLAAQPAALAPDPRE